MPETFARLEDTPYGQILATIQNGESSEGEEGPCVSYRIAERRGLTPEMTIGPWVDSDEGWAAARRTFENANLQETAEKLANMIDEMFGDLMDEES